MKSFEVKGKVFLWSGEGAWHFVYIPKDLSQRIRDSKGKGFVKVKATIGKTSWNTSLFPTKDGPYLISIKADVRHAEGISNGDSVTISCNVL